MEVVENTEVVVAEKIESADLTLIIDGLEIKESTRKLIIESFGGHFENINQWKEKVFSLVVEDESEVEKMETAKEWGKIIQKIRTSGENEKKELKRESINYGNAIQAAWNKLQSEAKAMEDHLKAQRDYAVIKKQEREIALQQERSDTIIKKQLSEYTLQGVAVGLMSEDEFDQYISLLESNKKDAEEKKAQEELKAKEEAEERERLRAENEKLRKEKEQKDKEIAAEKEKARQEERAKIAKETKAVEVLPKSKPVAQSKEVKVPNTDKEKLMDLAEFIDNIEYPELEGIKAVKVVMAAHGLMAKVSKYIRENA